MTKVYVNGNEMTLHESVGWLNYDRVVRLSGLPPRDDYVAEYQEVFGDKIRTHEIGGGVFPTDGMHFFVRPGERKPWWRWLWPA